MRDIKELLNEIEAWSNEDRENRVASVSLADKVAGERYLRFAGEMTDVGKCIYALMKEDLEIAIGIYSAVTMYAHKTFTDEIIKKVNEQCSAITELEEKGMTADEIYKILKPNKAEKE